MAGFFPAGEFLRSIVRFWNSGDSTDYADIMGESEVPWLASRHYKKKEYTRVSV